MAAELPTHCSHGHPCCVVTLVMVRWFLLQPVTRAAEWLRRLRQGDAGVEDGAKEFGYLLPLATK